MASQLFFGGLPTKPTVDKLLKAVEPNRGTSISYDDLETITEEKYGSSRFNTVINAWRKRLFREESIQTTRDGGMVHFLTDSDSLVVCTTGFRRTGKSMARVMVRAEAVRGDQLTEKEQVTHNLLRRLTRAQVEEIGKSIKEISPPRPTEGSSVRLAR